MVNTCFSATTSLFFQQYGRVPVIGEAYRYLGYTLGMLNFLMLFFLAIAPVILYLIFDHLGTGMVVTVIASIAIAYLSPQLDRFGGHFNLSYVAAIPWMILLLIKFFRKPLFLAFSCDFSEYARRSAHPFLYLWFLCHSDPVFLWGGNG